MTTKNYEPIKCLLDTYKIKVKEIFSNEDIMMINTVDSADYAKHDIEPEQVMNLIRDFEKGEQTYEKKWMLGLLTNKLLLAYKNKPGFLENLVMNSSPSLMNIYQNINSYAKEKGFASPEVMAQNQAGYIESQQESKNLKLDGY